ncbi:MAG: NAD(P)H-binding protein [Ignavibacteriaceae bacterium]|nr:NAD(P)H-binding protein [Ignavibacteriaceae bacterium]
MKVLILGASGKTGKLVVQQLIKRNIQVRMIVRESAIVPDNISASKQIEIIKGNVNDFDILKLRSL